MDAVLDGPAFLVNSERGEELLRQWNERAGVVWSDSIANGVALTFPTDLTQILMKVVPLILALITSGFTPAGLLALIPQIVAILFPTLDAGLVEILKQIIAFFVNRT